MSAGVVLDTSFLITLAGRGRHHHATALRYWRHFTESGVPIFLPTIVVSEFCVRQEIPADILRSCVILPFNWDDAQEAARIHASRHRSESDSRDALKDDVKILAQAKVKDAAFVITDDTRTLYRHGLQLWEQGQVAFRTIKLEDGFDLSFFNGGQRVLEMESNYEDDDQS